MTELDPAQDMVVDEIPLSQLTILKQGAESVF